MNNRMEKELEGHGCQTTEKDPQSSAEVQLTNTQFKEHCRPCASWQNGALPSCQMFKMNH